MKWLLKEKGNFGPFYIGLKADSSDFMKNFFEWEFPISKYFWSIFRERVYSKIRP